MKKEKVKKLCKQLGEKLHLIKEKPFSNIVIQGDQVLVNGKPIDVTKPEDLVLLYRIRGWM